MLHQIPAHQLGVSSLNIHNTTLCSTSNDDTAALWDLRSYDRIAALTAHKDCVNQSLFTRDGLGLLTCSDDRTVLCWDARQLAEPVHAMRGFKDGVNKMIFSHDGTRVISACDDGLVYIHELSTTELVDEFWVATNTVNDLVIEPEHGNVLVTCSEDCAIRTWKLLYNKEATSEDRLLSSFDEFENPINHTELHEGWLYAACSECIFAVDFAVSQGSFGEESRVFSCHTDYVRGMTFSASSGGNMLSCSDDGSVVEWEVAAAQPVRQVKLHESQIMAMALRRQHGEEEPEMLVTGCEGGLIRFWSLPFTTEKI